MVNPGHPSRGCFACRRKKVKCDETHPQCKRCVRVGKICPGYRVESDATYRFVDMGKSKHSLALLAHNNSRTAFDESISSSESSSDDSAIVSFYCGQRRPRGSAVQRVSMSAIPPLMSQPWEQLALPLFLNLFTTTPGWNLNAGLLSFLPELYQDSTLGSPLQLAVGAAVDANAVRKLADPQTILQARRKHVQALIAVQRAIDDPKHATKDSTLCSLFVLTIFEYISGDTTSAHGSHIDGYEALLDLRSREPNRTPRSYAVDLSVATQILVKHMRIYTTPGPRTSQIIENLKSSDPTTRVTQYCLKVAQFNHKARRLLTQFERVSSEEQLSDVYDIMTTGERLDEAARGWPSTDDLAYAYTVPDSPLSQWSGPFYIYGSLGAANDWNMMRSGRILLLTVVVKCCDALLQSGHPPGRTHVIRDKAQSTIRSLIRDTVASLPYCLGRGDARWDLPISGVGTSGFALLWPTGIVVRCSQSTPEQRKAALQMIEYIGRSLGMQRALFLKAAWETGDFL